MLSKYEILMEREIYRALHELERLQEVWEVTTVVSSWVLDIEVSGMREQLGSRDKRFLR
jgi:6-phosphogluconate dehydrogenase (decarboxylating)